MNHFNANGRIWCWISDKKNFQDCVMKQTMKLGKRLGFVEGLINAKNNIALL